MMKVPVRSKNRQRQHKQRNNKCLKVYFCAGCAFVICNCVAIYMWRIKQWEMFGNRSTAVSPQGPLKLGKPFEKDRIYHVDLKLSSDNNKQLPSGFGNAKHTLDKSKKYSLCVVGAGLSGTVFAERTANYLSQKVLVMDSRPHIGGTCYDYVDEATGILKNHYGSHVFHSNNEQVWKYIQSHKNAPKWKRWYPAELGFVNGDYVPFMINPGAGSADAVAAINIQTVNRLLDKDIRTHEEMKEWLQTVQIPCPPATGCQNAEQMAKSMVGEDLYKLLLEGYIMKQWGGKHPKELNATTLTSLTTSFSFDPRAHVKDKYQALPQQGYTAWFANMLKHPLIDVVLNADFFGHRTHLQQACDKIVYTGPIDRYFQETKEATAPLEKLEYRNVVFTEERHYNHPGYILPAPVVNYPGIETNYTFRAVEYKQYLHRPSNHSLVVREAFSGSSVGEPYLPVPTARNLQLHEKYNQLATQAEQTGKIQFVGGLTDYKYYNMDQAIDNALTLFYKSSPLKSDFMKNEFQAYKATIHQAMQVYRQQPTNNQKPNQKSCVRPPKWAGEFGMELRAMTPWAYYIRQQCGQVKTRGNKGTKYLYFFSKQHTIDHKNRYGKSDMPENSPFGAKGVHVREIPTDAPWHPPPYAEFFRRPEMEQGILGNDGKELVVILNKYSIEWKGLPRNYFSVETLRSMLDYLTPKYKVLYKRHTSHALLDGQGADGDLNEKEMIRKEYPDVLLFEDYAEAIQDVEDFNLLLFGFMSLSRKFLTVQGGTAVVGSYFGGTNIILIKSGWELWYGDYDYFHRFSNATILPRKTDETFLREMRNNM